MTKAKISRKGVHLGLAERNGEWRLLEGNRILSRHATEQDAVDALCREQAARVGRHTIPDNVAAAMERDPPRGFRSPWHA